MKNYSELYPVCLETFVAESIVMWCCRWVITDNISRVIMTPRHENGRVFARFYLEWYDENGTKRRGHIMDCASKYRKGVLNIISKSLSTFAEREIKITEINKNQGYYGKEQESI